MRTQTCGSRENRTPVIDVVSCGRTICTHPDGTHAAGNSAMYPSISSAPNRVDHRPGAPSSLLVRRTTGDRAVTAAHVASRCPAPSPRVTCSATRGRPGARTWRARTRPAVSMHRCADRRRPAATRTSPRPCDEAGRALPRRAGPNVRPRHRGDAAPLGPQWCSAGLDPVAGRSCREGPGADPAVVRPRRRQLPARSGSGSSTDRRDKVATTDAAAKWVASQQRLPRRARRGCASSSRRSRRSGWRVTPAGGDLAP